jgi:hypothetical protein
MLISQWPQTLTLNICRHDLARFGLFDISIFLLQSRIIHQLFYAVNSLVYTLNLNIKKNINDVLSPVIFALYISQVLHPLIDVSGFYRQL